MEYDCQIVPVIRPVLNSDGAMIPLCNDCVQLECSNPIYKKKISLFGKTKDWNVFVTGSHYYQVTRCSGYMRSTDENNESPGVQ